MEALAVRELKEMDIDALVHYWVDADPAYLVSMGVDLSKLPDKAQLTAMLRAQLSQSYNEKQSYCIIWLLHDTPVGHSNINRIEFGKEAYMHLHLWSSDVRKQGIGTTLVKMTLPFYFENFKLKKLLCEPYALNPAPNKTLQKVGFELLGEYTTVPGSINFEQPVKRWELSFHRYKEIYS